MKQHGLHHVSQSARIILGKLVEGLDALGTSRKVDRATGTFMACCIERVEETPHGPVFSVAHSYLQNGDLVPDPDVTLLRAADGEFYPLSYQDGRCYRLSVELAADGSVGVNRDRQSDLAHFVAAWMRNVKQQQGL